MDAIQITDLSKKFGENKVIDSLSLKVPQNSIFGFLGENGAGKTTTMKMILGLLKPDSGSIKVMGDTVTYGNTKTNKYIGYLPDVPEFYGFMNPKEYLKLCGEITGLNSAEIKARSNELLKLVGLENSNKKISGFSRGMKQRLGLAQALLNSPKILICDEPTSALDPVGRKEILDIIKKVSSSTTVMFSTHILSDIERICDRVGVLKQGKIVLSGTLQEVRGLRKTNTLLVEFKAQEELERFIAFDDIKKIIAKAEVTSNSVYIKSENISELHKIVITNLSASSLLPIKLEILEPTLEDMFVEVIN